MVNIDEFIKRLEIILDYYGLSASGFADKVGVQRSSLSHLLSGRNKPSLDLIMKIVSEFPEVDLYWIVNGNGNFPKNEIQNREIYNAPITEIDSLENENQSKPNLFSIETKEKNNASENLEDKISNTRIVDSTKFNEEIDRIVVFFKNGSFKSYIN